MVCLWIGAIYRGNGGLTGDRGLERVKRNKPKVSRADYLFETRISRDQSNQLSMDGRAVPEMELSLHLNCLYI